MGETLLLSYGLPALFVLSFLAATVVPLGSEPGVVLLCLNGLDPLSIFLTATAGNTLAAVVNYLMGCWGARLWRRRHPRQASTAWKKAHRSIHRWGAPVLFFAWAPVIGDPLTVAAGSLEIPVGRFLAWVTLGKGVRYYVVIKGALWAAVG
jgi:membrane protein YqaA with SNARE-associated domain